MHPETSLFLIGIKSGESLVVTLLRSAHAAFHRSCGCQEWCPTLFEATNMKASPLPSRDRGLGSWFQRFSVGTMHSIIYIVVRKGEGLEGFDCLNITDKDGFESTGHVRQ